jgi:hypothetical protein
MHGQDQSAAWTVLAVGGIVGQQPHRSIRICAGVIYPRIKDDRLLALCNIERVASLHHGKQGLHIAVMHQEMGSKQMRCRLSNGFDRVMGKVGCSVHKPYYTMKIE